MAAVEFWQWLSGLVIGAVAGGGGLFAYLNAQGQLDLDRTKHKDTLDEPRRKFILGSLQNAAKAYEDAIRVVRAARTGSNVYLQAVRVAKANVAASLPAIQSAGADTGVAFSVCKPISETFADWKPFSGDNDVMIQGLQMAATNVYDLINSL